jgi:hypothetical protein
MARFKASRCLRTTVAFSRRKLNCVFGKTCALVLGFRSSHTYSLGARETHLPNSGEVVSRKPFEESTVRVADNSLRARKHDMRAQSIFMERRFTGSIRRNGTLTRIGLAAPDVDTNQGGTIRSLKVVFDPALPAYGLSSLERTPNRRSTNISTR